MGHMGPMLEASRQPRRGRRLGERLPELGARHLHEEEVVMAVEVAGLQRQNCGACAAAREMGQRVAREATLEG